MTLRGWVFLIVMLRAGGATAQTPRPLVVGIDHIPVVVADLERAQADFRAMGFAIKPGRPHADGIRNAHVKFRDGTEIELITAPAAVDSLTAEYRCKISVFLGRPCAQMFGATLTWSGDLVLIYVRTPLGLSPWDSESHALKRGWFEPSKQPAKTIYSQASIYRSNIKMRSSMLRCRHKLGIRLGTQNCKLLILNMAG